MVAAVLQVVTNGAEGRRPAKLFAELERTVFVLIAEQFDAFAKGFRSVVNGLTLQLFSPWELELMVEGEQELDFAALKKI